MVVLLCAGEKKCYNFSELNSEFFYNFRNCIPNFRIFAKTKQR